LTYQIIKSNIFNKALDFMERSLIKSNVGYSVLGKMSALKIDIFKLTLLIDRNYGE